MSHSIAAHPHPDTATHPLTLPFAALGAADLPLVGGKGANLGEMTSAGFPVPPGFCVTTAAFQLFMAGAPDMPHLYQQIEALDASDVEAARRLGQTVRAALEHVPIPPAVAEAVSAAWQALGRDHAYAVRSSATAEDLPDASFAGQQDTYLNIRGEAALLEHIRRCWISLFTDRAILYRQQHGFDHRRVALAVVVQQMVQPEVSGIMFTADPVTGHRKITSIDASFGLGEALVSGLVSADLYQVDSRTHQLVKRQIADKQLAIRAVADGGVVQVPLEGAARTQPALTDAQVLELAALGRRIEHHYGTPQDIEWALAQGRFFVVQSRPITSLYPLPQPRPSDDALHLYISFSHLQVMTDPMPTLALSVWRILFPLGRPLGQLENPMVGVAGGRLYIDGSLALRHPLLRRVVPRLLQNGDMLVAQAVAQLVARPEFYAHGARAEWRDLARWMAPMMLRMLQRLWWKQPAGDTQRGNEHIAQFVAETQQQLAAAHPGANRVRVAARLLSEAFFKLVWVFLPPIIAGMVARLLLHRLFSDASDQEALTALVRGLEGNVTTEMDLAVGELADRALRSPELVRHLSQPGVDPAHLIESAATIPGGEAFLTAWRDFLARYGMRGPSEIDISRPRWRDEPSSLLQMVRGALHRSTPGSASTHHQALVAAGEAAAMRLVARARQGPLGWLRGPIVQRLVRVARQLLALREHHKFGIIQQLGLVRQSLLEAGALLVARGQLTQPEEVWHLSLPELIEALEQPPRNLAPLIQERQAALARFQHLTPPRVMSSDGEIPVVRPAAIDAPEGALVGSPVSAGVVEGVARVVQDPQTEVLRHGEILVAPFTDPGWTPLFINAAGLVMEVGGLMTHGSVVAREYGIPAVVGVVDATKRITTGQRVRVHGDRGYVELLPPAPPDVPAPASDQAPVGVALS